MNFADRLIQSIQRNKSFIVAGFDPQLETFPRFILEEAAAKTANSEDAVFQALLRFHAIAIEALSGVVSAVKPNIAFFEQYGISGLLAFSHICKMLKEREVPIIADVKRGDIGSTAKAYSAAYLGRAAVFGKPTAMFDVDAITVNPFLGFDTVETYFDDCKEYGKGIFVLVKTSNPGSATLQGIQSNSGKTISESVAQWLGEKAEQFVGTSGYSSLGAVVGATYPDEARALRKIMPKNFLLIPGMGAQGGSAQDAVAGFSTQKSGALINISRGLLGSIPATITDSPALGLLIRNRALEFNAQVAAALA
ncbi:MAG: orotidine-5'-phosphate decarboxylase [Deltaproteobacteria bacterium]|nr:orotidine-5'-phosphate decarboxylase [Deltaproteobacteria bacterium]